MTDRNLTIRVRLIKDTKRAARPYELVRYYADGTKRTAGFYKNREIAEIDQAHIQAAIDGRKEA